MSKRLWLICLAVMLFLAVGNAIHERSWIALTLFIGFTCGVAARVIGDRTFMLHQSAGDTYHMFRAGRVEPYKGLARTLDRAFTVCVIAAIGMGLYRLAA
jgi:hypothetical protein